MNLGIALEDLSQRASRYCINLNELVDRDDTFPPLRGSSALVYRGTLRREGAKVAVKTFRSGPSGNEATLKLVFRELHLWSKLRHENIVRLLGVTTTFDFTVSIVSEWMAKGDAYNYVQDTSIDPRPLLVGIAHGLHYLHNHPQGPIFHGDLKGLNSLDSDWVVTAATDIWAFGMTTLELFTRVPPFHPSPNPTSVMVKILRGVPNRPSMESACSRLTDEWWNLCLLCWNREPSLRPSMSDIVDRVMMAISSMPSSVEMSAPSADSHLETTAPLEPSAIPLSMLPRVSSPQTPTLSLTPRSSASPPLPWTPPSPHNPVELPGVLRLRPSAASRQESVFSQDHPQPTMFLDMDLVNFAATDSQQSYSTHDEPESERSILWTLHPFLNGEAPVTDLYLDLAFPAFSPSRIHGGRYFSAMPPELLFQFATIPPIRKMQIIHDAMPQWPIKILPRDDYLANNAFPPISLGDVLYNIHATIRRQVTHPEWEQLNRSEQVPIADAYTRRYKRTRSSSEAGLEANHGVRRIDYLKDKHFFRGLIRAESDEPGFSCWKLLTGVDPRVAE